MMFSDTPMVDHKSLALLDSIWTRTLAPVPSLPSMTRPSESMNEGLPAIIKIAGILSLQPILQAVKGFVQLGFVAAERKTQVPLASGIE